MGRPWWKVWARRVFIDRSTIPLFTRMMCRLRSLPDQSIEKILSHALSLTASFVLIASPEAAQSKWVNFEVETWLKMHKLDHFVIVLIGGEILSCSNNKIDWQKTNALPLCLRDALNEMPLWVDLRDDFPDDLQRMNHPTIRRAVVLLTAAIENIPDHQIPLLHRGSQLRSILKA
jgi:hypothetical protein